MDFAAYRELLITYTSPSEIYIHRKLNINIDVNEISRISIMIYHGYNRWKSVKTVCDFTDGQNCLQSQIIYKYIPIPDPHNIMHSPNKKKPYPTQRIHI